MKNKRLAQSRDKKLNLYTRQIDWREIESQMEEENGFSIAKSPQSSSNSRKKAGPIEIVGLPGYENLSKEETTLCSLARLLPSSYIEYKKLLKDENLKTGYLRLADARRLIKIDVNKTRQIYDFLLEHGEINKPFSYI